MVESWENLKAVSDSRIVMREQLLGRALTSEEYGAILSELFEATRITTNTARALARIDMHRAEHQARRQVVVFAVCCTLLIILMCWKFL